MGTLGVIAAAEIRLLPAKRYVRLQYQPVHSFAAATELTLKLSEGDDDFIDGIMFGRDHGVVITGTFSDTKEGRLQRFSRAHDQWFYLHAQDIDARGEPVVETVPLRDYLFRYDRGAFWVGRFAFERFGIPYNRFFRWLLNPLFNTRKLYQALQASAASQEHIVQDLTLPPASAEKFLDFIDEATGIYPLWLCPLKTELRSPLMCSGLKAPLGINVGVWGPRMRDYDEFVRLNRDIEAKVTELGGKKWLYAHTYYTEEEFWKLYDRKWYDRLRRRYHAVSLPDIYEKVRVRERFRVEGRRGALRTISGTAKIRIK
jgi:FAD/FMN-containing dehydrogenase